MVCLLKTQVDYEAAKLDELIATFFAIFYVDDAYLTLQDADFLQQALFILVDLFGQVGLLTNTKKTQVMICTAESGLNSRLTPTTG